VVLPQPTVNKNTPQLLLCRCIDCCIHSCAAPKANKTHASALLAVFHLPPWQLTHSHSSYYKL
jgi:hypothetical protein